VSSARSASGSCALAVLLVAGLATALSVAPAHAATTDGPVLTVGWPPSLRQPDGTVVAELRNFDISRETRFSPTGDRIAYVRTDGETDEDFVVVQHHQGEVDEYGPVAGMVQDLDWSPDGSQLALLTSQGFDQEAIVRMPLDGGGPVTLAADSAAFDVQPSSGISWGVNGSIIFVGGEPEPGGFFQSVHASQLYTVPAAGGAASRFNVHLPDDGCTEEEVVCDYQFENPEWSPNGSSVVAEVERNPYEGSSTRYLSVVAAGVTHPSSATALRDPNLGFSSFQGPQYSPDGGTIWFQDDDGDTLYTATLSGGVRTRMPATFEWIADVQPCDDDVCLDWGQVVPKEPTAISLNVNAAQRIRVNGQVNPNRAGQAVTIVLKRQVQGVWRRVAAKRPTLSVRSRYVANFSRPSGLMCQVTARYPGDATYAPSSRRVDFYC
jgi:hypothetical protein